uniref:protein trichome birefringence-like n=1 Tax=Erigeron canadensis TaxID=72917 RepID=UPI001CB9A07B|nr:protein trichome birefringence-like [Erigeron canadensis]
MADSTKYVPITSRTLVSDLKLKNILSFRTKKTRNVVYVFVAIFIVVTLILAFNPSSPWFSNIFTTTRSPSSSSSYSQFSSIYSCFFPSNSSKSLHLSSPNSNVTIISYPTTNLNKPHVKRDPQGAQNQTQVNVLNQTRNRPKLATEFNEAALKNVTENGIQKPSESMPKYTGNGSVSGSSPKFEGKNRGNNVTSLGQKQGIEEMLKGLVDCNFFDGEWVRDETYPLYKPGSCSLIDKKFNCFSNGRPDLVFQQYKWKPKGCTLPRLDGSKMLQMLRGKRLVFVGDSLNRNMWESLVCILRNSVKDQSKVHEVSGTHNFVSERFYAFLFKDYNCTVEYFKEPFLVQELVTTDKYGTKKETLRLDMISNLAHQYRTADVVVFNTGHWWTHEKTAKGKDYYQEGGHVYSELNVLEAFRKALTTWGMWVDANINPAKTSVFFRGYSASHFSGRQWNSRGACDHEVEPIYNTTYLTTYPDKMVVLEKVFKGMKTQVSYLNITRLTDFRKDGHPSIYRKQHYSTEELKSPLHFQDCSHWCLPGVPDVWNEILYAQLLVKQYQSQQKL